MKSGKLNMKYTMSWLAVAAAAVVGFAPVAHGSEVQLHFHIGELQTQAHSTSPASVRTGSSFDSNFSGCLVTSLAPRSDLLGPNMSGSDSLGEGWTVTSFAATQSFVGGMLVDGRINIVARHIDGDMDTFDATLGSDGERSIAARDDRDGGFAISGSIRDVSLRGIGAANNTFAGVDLSTGFLRQWLGSSFLLEYKPDMNGVDAGSELGVIISVIPLPAPLLMSLTGLLPVVVLGLRRKRKQYRSTWT